MAGEKTYRYDTSVNKKKNSYGTYPYLKEKIPMGLLPYVQSMLLAKFVRGEIDEYPCYLAR